MASSNLVLGGTQLQWLGTSTQCLSTRQLTSPDIPVSLAVCSLDRFLVIEGVMGGTGVRGMKDDGVRGRSLSVIIVDVRLLGLPFSNWLDESSATALGALHSQYSVLQAATPIITAGSPARKVLCNS